MRLTLFVGTRNWSSWSLRPWAALRFARIPFESVDVPLRKAGAAEAVRAVSPSGLVPVLKVGEGDGAVAIWDSLAICEFAAERAPHLWPADRQARAFARSMVAEMHSGFADLRRQLSMAFAETVPGVTPEPKVAEQIARIEDLWTQARTRYGAGGPYLFGAEPGIADAFYAPVVSRFRTYGVRLRGPAAEWAQTLWDHPAMQDWLKAAEAELAAGLPRAA